MNRVSINDMILEHTTRGVRQACRNLWEEIRVQRLHFASVRRAKRLPKSSDIKLHLGCGPCLKPGWVNVDMYAPQADLHLDLREGFPFPDECASFVYCEHFFEHLEYPSPALNFLGDCWRVLKPGGTLSLGVPDTEWPVISYANGDSTYFDLARDRFHPDWCNTRMHSLNYHFRQAREHKYAYDLETLKQALEKAGFVSVERRDFIPGLDSDARKVDALPRKTAGLYVDARKPCATA
jgi:predicted SAM-dependent methyltransferase